MKKLYSFLTILSLATMIGHSQKILILAQDKTDPIVLSLEQTIKSSWSGITTDIQLVAGIVDWPKEAFADYAAAFITEWGGSKSVGDFGRVGVHEIPFVCLKAYAIKRAYPQWHWISGDSTNFWNQAKDITLENFNEGFVGVVEDASHPIFGNFYKNGDEFTWTTDWANDTSLYATIDPHIQCIDLKNAANDDIKNASTMLATNKFANNDTKSPVNGWMWAVEANDSSKRAVICGVHHLLCGYRTEEFNKILQNSLAWILGHDIPNVYTPSGLYEQTANEFNLKCIPNPAADQVQIGFNLNESSVICVNINDLTGRTVFEHNETLPAGNQLVDVNISHFAPGMYIYQVNANGKMQTGKFIAK